MSAVNLLELASGIGLLGGGIVWRSRRKKKNIPETINPLQTLSFPTLDGMSEDLPTSSDPPAGENKER